MIHILKFIHCCFSETNDTLKTFLQDFFSLGIPVMMTHEHVRLSISKHNFYLRTYIEIACLFMCIVYSLNVTCSKPEGFLEKSFFFLICMCIERYSFEFKTQFDDNLDLTYCRLPVGCWKESTLFYRIMNASNWRIIKKYLFKIIRTLLVQVVCDNTY